MATECKRHTWLISGTNVVTCQVCPATMILTRSEPKFWDEYEPIHGPAHIGDVEPIDDQMFIRVPGPKFWT